VRRLGAAVCGAALLAGCSQTVAGHGTVSALPSAGAPKASTTATTPATPTGSPAAPGTSGPEQLPITFAGCGSLFDSSAVPVPDALQGKITYGCGTIKVPLDYADPGGQQLSIELVKVHDTDNGTPLGSLLVNPGGPGGSGFELALGLTGQLSPSLLARFDLVGFDPRGVGLSSPVRCLSDAQKDRINAASPDVLTTAGFAAAKDLAKQTAEACSTKYGPALAQYNTVNTARDMDQIRKAVGEEKMNYLGFSYGTELGSIYAHLFPDRIRVAVLDGAVDPLTTGIASWAAQLAGFESAFDQFAADCLKRSPCKTLGNPRDVVYAIARTAAAHPLSTSDAGETRQVTRSLVLTGVLEALYARSEWPTLGAALLAARTGDGSGLLKLADSYNQRYGGRYSNIMEANTAISCNDEKPGPTDEAIRTTARAWAKTYPMFGTWSAISLFGCQQWQPQRTPVPLPTAATPVKVLVIGNLHDPATPYQGAVDLAKTMGNAELLSWDGEGHTSYLQGSSCVDNYVNAYLLRQKLPPPDTTCPR
jgi:pimeloyl-ACP methyl ester carboxylesterase